MPSRIIREGILTSERIDQLDPASEVFYRRLLNRVDDHGLYDARPAILRTSLFPLRVDRVREADLSRWLAACEMAGLLALYVHDGKPYLQVRDTRWTARSEPKYPLPPENTCEQLQAVTNTCTQLKTVVTLDVVEDEEKQKKPRKRGANPIANKPDDVSEPVWLDFLALRRAKKAPVTETVMRGARLQASKADLALEQFLEIWCRRGSQGLEADWLKPREGAPARDGLGVTSKRRQAINELMQGVVDDGVELARCGDQAGLKQVALPGH